MGSPTTIGIDDDFSTSETSITMWPTNDESARRVEVEDGFFKQKTAYEILTCDWSSDVCSSDLG